MKPSPFDPFAELTVAETRPSPRVLDALRAEVKSDLGTSAAQGRRPKGRSRVTRVFMSFGTLVVLLVALSPKALRLVPESLLWGGLVYGIVASLLLFVGGIPGNMTWFSRRERKGVVFTLPPLLLVGLAWSARYFDLSDEFLSDIGLKAAAACLTHSLLVGALSTIALIAIWRRSDPFAPGFTGALLGILGGLLGTLSTDLGCASTEGVHLTLSHGLVAVVLGVVGQMAGRKWLTP